MVSGRSRTKPGLSWLHDSGRVHILPAGATGSCRRLAAERRNSDNSGTTGRRKQAPSSSILARGFHLNRLPTEKLRLAEIDADHWKTWVHQRLSTPLGSPGAMTLFQASPQEHLALAKHLTAEVKTE